MKSKKLKVAALLAFCVGIGFSVTASAIAVDWGCMQRCLKNTNGEGGDWCVAMCDARDPIG
jgi:hypothetical protein